MKQRSVVFSPEAVEDLTKLYEWIADRAGESVAIEYIDRIEAFCGGSTLPPREELPVTTFGVA